MGPLGWQETMVIFVLALLIFGPKKLPELGKTIGKAITEFRRASSELKGTWDREMAAMERETEPVRQAIQDYGNQIHNSYSDVGSYDSDPYGDPYYAGGASESNPSTVSASAPQGAESTAVNGNGARESATETVNSAESTESQTPAGDPAAMPVETAGAAPAAGEQEAART
jgi:sec-independent protein translocase protein TatA